MVLDWLEATPKQHNDGTFKSVRMGLSLASCCVWTWKTTLASTPR